MKTIELTKDQQQAFQSLLGFIKDPEQPAMILAGYSGTGKSTLMKFLIAEIKKLKLKYDLVLTATTNKAAENLAHITGETVTTIHSFLGLQVVRDWKTRQTELVWRDNSILQNSLIVIDEASYIDKGLLEHIYGKTRNCKFLFVGDPSQLLSVGSDTPVVFESGIPYARLNQVVRQAEDNPIIDLSTRFRKSVDSGKFFDYKPDGQAILNLSKEEFRKEILKEFTDPKWHFHRSKVLAWTNRAVMAYNHWISEHVVGRVEFQAGDYAICNRYVSKNHGVETHRIKTDALVHITSVSAETERFGYRGRNYVLDDGAEFFGPLDIESHEQALHWAISSKNRDAAREIDREWVDLRPAYACTVNKAQGSTFERVFIDLNDISRCRDESQVARMLYVAVSRASKQVILLGELDRFVKIFN